MYLSFGSDLLSEDKSGDCPFDVGKNRPKEAGVYFTARK
jgi:hypothetical protein